MENTVSVTLMQDLKTTELCNVWPSTNVDKDICIL